MLVPVILAGGSGSRLWPLSRSIYPKQFLPLVSNLTLFQETVLRAQSIPHSKSPVVICHHEHRFLVAEQLKKIGVTGATIMLEPAGKNTAPAAAIAALYCLRRYQDSPLLVMPADHLIPDVESFIKAVDDAVLSGQAGYLVTLGVKPLRAETGYGYIRAANQIDGTKSFKVTEFVEKPDVKTAEAYLASQQYYWNSGLFVFQPSTFLTELKSYAPVIFEHCERAIDTITTDLDFIRLNEKTMSSCPADSIDYAVMEHTQRAVVVPFNAGWSDAGSWASLLEIQPQDEHGCVTHGDVITEKVKNSYLRAESRLLAAVGVSDHIVVETADAVLVAHKDYAQSLKDLVDRLKQQKRRETQSHCRVYRPWGYYETIDAGEGFQVKRISVNSGASLSLQLHKYRSEHWVVIRGAARVTRGDELFTITANESTYIPQGVKHRLENTGETVLEIIEVQSGSYLGEDDILRFDDVYGRTLEETSIGE